MAWVVEFHEEYLAEFRTESVIVQKAVLVAAGYLQHSGPQLKRPYSDTLNGSSYPNMKELRITISDGEWRVAYAFDPQRKAILLTGASKSGVGQKDFYKKLIHAADRRYANHLAHLKKKGD